MCKIYSTVHGTQIVFYVSFNAFYFDFKLHIFLMLIPNFTIFSFLRQETKICIFNVKIFYES
jgi:hypothetical protein